MLRENPEHESLQGNQGAESIAEEKLSRQINEIRERFKKKVEEKILKEAMTIIYSYLLNEKSKEEMEQEIKKLTEEKLTKACRDVEEEKENLDLRAGLISGDTVSEKPNYNEQ